MINEKENLEMCKIQQKHFLHNLLSIKENEVEIDRNGNFTYSKISPTTKNDCFRVQINGISNLKQSSIQFILFVLHQATSKNLNIEDNILYLDPKEYKGYRNLKNQDSLRDKINQDIKVLVQMFLEFDDLKFRTNKITHKTTSYNKKLFMNLCSSSSIYRKKIIQIAFTPEFLEYYRSLPCMYVPKEIFSIDTRRNKNSLSLLWRLSTLKKMNEKKTNNGIVSVTNLLNHCSCIPNYNKIKHSGQIKQRIIDPFIRDLEVLKSIEWQFIDEFNNVVDKSQVKSYIQFVNLKVKYDFKNADENEMSDI